MEAVPNNDGQLAESLSAFTGRLYTFVLKIQRPRPRDRRWSVMILDYCGDVSDYCARIQTELSETRSSLSRLLDEMMEKVREYSRELSGTPNARRLKEMGRSLSRIYEKLLLTVKDLKIPFPAGTPEFRHLKPLNYYRNAFHMSLGVVAVVLYELVLTHGQAMAILLTTLGVFTFLEVSRKFSERFNDFLVDKVFGIIARPHERFRVNSSTWYLAALTLMTSMTPKTALEIGILVLAFGDPAASVMGRRWGRVKLWREKSVVGTSAFALASLVVSYVFLALAVPEMGWGARVAVSLAAALSGAATELFSQRINDNFTIPVVAAGVAAFWF
ncbi:MAG: diacylglycerol/polyprenol kinase family protein [Pseudomonadota bacterium]